MKKTQKLVVLATGGTLAGWADSPDDPHRYQAGVIPVEALVAGMPQFDALCALEVVTEQVAQVDSKDMTHAIWLALAQRCAHHLADPQVQGVVITHGTDTAEETAFFLHCVLPSTKPIALTCAMRPVNAKDADGPANLRDAMLWVATSSLSGVVLVAQGAVHAAAWVQKVHSHALSAFSSRPHDAMATIKEGVLCVTANGAPRCPNWPAPTVAQLPPVQAWPCVQVVSSHAGCDGTVVEAVMRSSTPAQGWIVAATGAGTVHDALMRALQAAQLQGARVWRASRCNEGKVLASNGDAFESAGELTPYKARIALMLALMG